MMTSDDKVGGWVKKGQNHDDVILEWSLTEGKSIIESSLNYIAAYKSNLILPNNLT